MDFDRPDVTALRLRFPPVIGAVPHARDAALRVTSTWDTGVDPNDVALVVTELAANAALHARTAFDVVIRRRPDRVDVEVRDASSTPLQWRVLTSDAADGRGLWLVDALADQWGSDVGPDGKCVWARFLEPA